MLNHSRIISQRVALESFAGANATELLTNTFPNLYEGIVKFFGTFNPNEPSVELNKDEIKFIKSLEAHKYSDLMPLLAYVPDGLNTDYLSYAKTLLPAAAHAATILSNTLSKYTVFLGGLINNQDSKFSTNSFEITYRELERVRDDLNKKIGMCFKHGSSKSEVTYGDVVTRNNDWERLLPIVRNMTQLINGVDRKQLNNKIKECGELLDVILKKVENKEFEGMSPEAITNLSDGAYQMARELEFFSSVYYRVMSLTTCIKHTMEHYYKCV